MYFDRYYYPALKFIDSSNYPLRLNQIALTDLDASYIKSIYDELTAEGYCNIDNEVISLTDKAKQYLIDNNPNPDNKELKDIILEHIKVHNAYGHKIDIVSTFLHEVATEEQRKELILVIRQLKKDGYIEMDGEENHLLARSNGRYTSVFQSGIKASLTDKGEEYLHPKPPVVPQIIHRIENSPGAFIGNNNQSSIIADTILTNPATINETPTKNNTAKKALRNIIITVIGTLLAAIAIWYFHLNAIRH